MTTIISGNLGVLGGTPRTTVNDAAYQIADSDNVVAMTAISAARIMTLPAASSYPVGRLLTIVDESGSVTATNKISLAPTGAAKIDGSNTTQEIINVPRGRCVVYTNGTDWFLIEVSVIYLSTFSGVPLPGSYGNIATTAQGTVGKWRVCVTFTATNGTGASNCSTRIYDGTTAYQSSNLRLENTGFTCGGALAPRVVASPAGSLAFQAINPSLGSVSGDLVSERVI